MALRSKNAPKTSRHRKTAGLHQKKLKQYNVVDNLFKRRALRDLRVQSVGEGE